MPEVATDNPLATITMRPGTVVTVGQGVPAGLENVEADDLILPHLLLMQGQSKLVQNKGKTVGKFVNSLTEEQYDSVEFIPVVYSRYFNVYRYEGKPEQKVFEFRTSDKEDRRLDHKRWFREEEDKAEIQTVRSFIGLISGKPIVVDFKSPSDLDGGKKLLTFAKLSGIALYGNKYKIIAKLKQFEKSSVFIKDVEPAGAATADELAAAAAVSHAFVSKHQVHAEEPEA